MQMRERAGGGAGRHEEAGTLGHKFFFFLFFDIVIWQTGNIWEACGQLPVRRHRRRHGGKTASAGSGEEGIPAASDLVGARATRKEGNSEKETLAHFFLLGSKQVFPLSSNMQLQYPTSKQLRGLSGDVTTSKPQEEDTTSEFNGQLERPEDKSKKLVHYHKLH